MKLTPKVLRTICLVVLVALGAVPALAGTLTPEEITQIETDLGITLSAQEKLDLGAIAKPDSSPAWRTAAEARIASHRQASLNVQVVDSVGTPVPGAAVDVKLTKNAFKFGGVANVVDHTDASSNLSNDGQTTAYWQRVTTNLFNAVGLNNGFKPKLTSQHQYIPGFMSWASANNLDTRAHLLIWPGGTHLSTASTSDYAHYNVSGALSTYTNNPTQLNEDALKAEVDAEIAEWAGRWDVYEWDVINETRGNHDLQDILGYDQEAEWFNIGEANKVNPNAKLYINENQIISAKSETLQSGYYTDRRDIYYATIDRIVASNAPIHGIGFQNRYKWEHPDPADVYSRLDEFGTRYGLQLAGTEFEIKDHYDNDEPPNPVYIPGEYTRAQITEETMTVYYSHALAAGLNAWDYMENDISSLSYYDGTIKLNGLVWYYLHRIRYNTEANGTTDVSGNAPVVGYKGDYEILVSYNGTDYPATVTLSSNQTTLVTLGDIVLVAPSTNAPVFTADPINKPDAAENVAYVGQSITNSATDVDGDTIIYSTLLGPAWLSMAPNGDLSGTPASSDVGQNSWLIEASDGFNMSTGVLSIVVAGGGGGGPPVTVAVSEDQFIHSNFPDEVQVLDGKLDARNSAHSHSRIPYLKFATGSLTGTIASVTLNIFSESELDVVDALAVSDSSWQAGTLTWNNAPARGLVIGSGQASSANSWFSIDLTGYITGSGTYSVALNEQGNTSRDYLASSRSSNDAYLDITFAGAGNNPPTFDSDPINGGNVVQDTAYAGISLADFASDVDLDSMAFGKVSGSSWLTVATNGSLSGTPLVGDFGSNRWKIWVTDGIATNFATLEINVSAPLPPPVSPQNGTNILFIAIDDINPVLGCYGDPLAISPNIDSLATSGVTFLNAHCQWSVCGPSRASLMTGLMPEETGVQGFRKMRGDAVDSGRENSVKRPNVVTIPQYFRYNGYRTAATGKINDNRCVGTLDTGTLKVAEDGSTVDDPPSWGDRVDPNALPVDFFSNSSFVKAASGWDPAGKPVTAAADLPDSDFTDGKACDVGISLLQNLATNDTQFFLGVGFKKPHLAFIAPQYYWDLHDINDFSIHPFQDHPLHEVSYTWNYAAELAGYDEFAIDGNSVTNIPEALQKQMLHGYYACVSFIDAQVGRLLDELETQGLADNTIVVLWGDHGFHLGDHAEWAKHTNLEQATRVPFIIHNPFSGQSNVQTETPVALMDIYPTLCELAGLPIPQQPLAEYEDPTAPAAGRSLKGQSLAGVVNGTESSVRTGAVNVFSRSGHFGYAYRTDRYRYTEWVNKSSNVVTERELYDYTLDPMETVNLAGEPGYDALMYSFSQAMRNEFDAMKLSASDFAAAELQGSPVSDTTAGNYSLRGIELSGNSIAWPDAAGVTYNLMSKTNLTDATWTTNQAGLTESPVVIPQTEQQEFYKVDVN